MRLKQWFLTPFSASLDPELLQLGIEVLAMDAQPSGRFADPVKPVVKEFDARAYYTYTD